MNNWKNHATIHHRSLGNASVAQKWPNKGWINGMPPLWIQTTRPQSCVVNDLAQIRGWNPRRERQETIQTLAFQIPVSWMVGWGDWALVAGFGRSFILWDLPERRIVRKTSCVLFQQPIRKTDTNSSELMQPLKFSIAFNPLIANSCPFSAFLAPLFA